LTERADPDSAGRGLAEVDRAFADRECHCFVVFAFADTGARAGVECEA
jgi:hypothetical protein